MMTVGMPTTAQEGLAKYLMGIISTMEGSKKGTLDGTLRLKVFGS
jgi:hypothetical protein